MSRKTFKTHVHIHAPASKVWEVLFSKDVFKIWASEFSKGSEVETDWKQGSKVVFKDASNSGLVGEIIENIPNESMVIEFNAELVDGKEVKDSESAKNFIGAREGYFIAEHGGMTHLDVVSEIPESMFDEMSNSWEKALEKIIALAETMF